MSAKPMVIAAARVLARRNAEACNVDAEDVWNLHAEDFTQDAEAALSAAGAPELLEALQEVTLILDAVLGVSGGYPRDADGPAIKARAAIAKATGVSA